MRIRALFLAGLGFVFLAIGAVGLFLPLLPTTPFVLLAAACFSGTPRIKARIMKIRFFREHLENYKKRTGLSKKNVAISLIWLWGMLAFSALMIQKLPILLLLMVVGICVTVHILLMSRVKIPIKESPDEAYVRNL